MKQILFIASIIILNQCSVFTQNSECSRQAVFGEKEICLPKIDGYQECYSEPIVKELADATEVPINSVLGFYLSDDTYDKKDSLGFISFDDYFKIYGTKEIQDMEANNSSIKQMIQLLSDNFMFKNWAELSQEIDKIGFDVEIGVPIVIENYRINDESFTMVMLTKYEIEGVEPYTLAMTINGYIKNERLVWMAYYLNYKNQKTVKSLKERSNAILQDLIDADE